MAKQIEDKQKRGLDAGIYSDLLSSKSSKKFYITEKKITEMQVFCLTNTRSLGVAYINNFILFWYRLVAVIANMGCFLSNFTVSITLLTKPPEASGCFPGKSWLGNFILESCCFFLKTKIFQSIIKKKFAKKNLLC